jgi:hypothetical protein
MRQERNKMPRQMHERYKKNMTKAMTNRRSTSPGFTMCSLLQVETELKRTNQEKKSNRAS